MKSVTGPKNWKYCKHFRKSFSKRNLIRLKDQNSLQTAKFHPRNILDNKKVGFFNILSSAIKCLIAYLRIKRILLNPKNNFYAWRDFGHNYTRLYILPQSAKNKFPLKWGNNWVEIARNDTRWIAIMSHKKPRTQGAHCANVLILNCIGSISTEPQQSGVLLY